MQGIYEIRHLPSRRIYVGSSDNMKRRLRAHRAMLRRGIHDNAWLQRTWNRDGEGAFEFRIYRRINGDLQHVRQCEAEAIAARGANVFNVSPVVCDGGRAPNASMSEEVARAIYDRAALGENARDLAVEYGASYNAVRRLIFGRTYSSITGGKAARAPVRARAERVKLTKLTAESVSAIRRRIADGEAVADLAREYGVSHRAIVCVRDRISWKHV